MRRACDPIVSLLILFILFSMFFVLIHDYTLCFTGSPCCNFSYYNYISIYIVIHLRVKVTFVAKMTSLYLYKDKKSMIRHPEGRGGVGLSWYRFLAIYIFANLHVM